MEFSAAAATAAKVSAVEERQSSKENVRFHGSDAEDHGRMRVMASNLGATGRDERIQRVIARQKASRDAALARARAALRQGHEEPNRSEQKPWKKRLAQAVPEPSASDAAPRTPEADEAPRQQHLSLHQEKQKAKQLYRQRGAQNKQNQVSTMEAQLQIPEWMTTVPSGFSRQEWILLPRPEGVRCIVLSANGQTLSRKKDGRVMHIFQSSLPNGSKKGRSARHSFSVLECIFYAPLNTYFVVDMLCWKGAPMYDAEASFRFFWIESRLAEVPQVGEVAPGSNDYAFVSAPRFDLTLATLEEVYHGKFGFQLDGFLFYNKQGHIAQGVTPLVQQWKDAHTSRYPIDTPDGVNPYPVQMCVLRACQEDPSMLSCLGGDVVAQLQPDDPARGRLQGGELARFAITGAVADATTDLMETQSLADDAVSPAGTAPERLYSISGLQFCEPCPNRSQPDSSCKIAFQYAMRHHPLSIHDIAHAMSAAAPASAP